MNAKYTVTVASGGYRKWELNNLREARRLARVVSLGDGGERTATVRYNVDVPDNCCSGDDPRIAVYICGRAVRIDR